MHATFTLRGQPIMCIDSPAVHDWTFTPAISLAGFRAPDGHRFQSPAPALTRLFER